MIDSAKQIQLEPISIGKVKGKTRIELTTVKTGEKKIIEKTNVFQNTILSRYLRSLGAANNNPFANSTWAGRPLWRNLCGGIFLFRDAIDLTGGDVEYMPATNLMVANGAYNVSNTGNPPELGSYNGIESSTSGANSLSFVYDWGTSQGNGTIGCICLTSETGGYIGYGNASGYRASSLRNIFLNQSTNKVGAHAYYNGQRIRIVSVNYTTKKITVAKSNDCVTVSSIFQGQNESTSEISYSGTPLGNGSGTTYVRAASENEVFIYKTSAATSIFSGESAGLLFYNFVNNTAEVVTINNTSNETLRVDRTSSMVGVSKDKQGNIYIATSTDGIAKFDSSGTFVKVYADIGGISPYFGMITPDIPYSSAGNSNIINMIYGADARQTNGAVAAGLTHFSAIDALCEQTESRITMESGYLSPYKNPLYLATVNNLETAVTKDSTQTMKVIYTLTEAV